MLTVPSPFSAHHPRSSSDEENDASFDLASALQRADLDVPGHQLGGWPDVIQSDMEQECQLVSPGVRMGSPGDHAETYRPGMEAGAEDWVLLWQLDSDEEGAGWMWGDLGKLYVWVKKQDLARRAFGNVWLVLQCT